jgi:transcriptional regulator with XRE-family HTH domain
MARRLKLREAAALTGLNTGYISRILRGKANPTFDTIRKLADAYDVPTTELLAHITEKRARREVA